MSKICNVTEGLIEVLLEQQAYSEVQVTITFFITSVCFTE